MRPLHHLFAWAVIGAAASAVIGGCGDSGGTAASVGSVEIDLAVGSSVTVSEARYAITRGAFTRGGLLDLSHSTTVSAVIDALPPAAGYRLAMTLTASEGMTPLDCAGDAMFDVTAGMATPVPVHIACHEVRPPAQVPISPVALAVLSGLLLTFGFWRRRQSAT